MGIHKPGVAMKHCRLLLLSLYLSLPSVFSLSCPRKCRPGFLKRNIVCEVCKTVVSADCSTKEVVYGICGCPVCARAEGEKCNGLWSSDESCASFLTCKLEKPKRPKPKLHWSGVCVKKEVKKSFWQKMMDYFLRLFKLSG